MYDVNKIKSTIGMIYVQKFKIAIDKEDKSKNMRQRNRAMKYIINNTAEGHNNHDLSLTHIYLINSLLRFIIRTLEV